MGKRNGWHGIAGPCVAQRGWWRPSVSHSFIGDRRLASEEKLPFEGMYKEIIEKEGRAVS